ncbi:MAG: outer membrane lipoprotein carrier protein LolA [Candidatus Omnitrophica bacterium]|nr:outer membrane lipoprotein carrier protein LolA [Candidatus Omnitrophota bacterium]
MRHYARRVLWSLLAAAWLLPQAASAFSVAYDQKVTTQGQVIVSTVRLKDDQFRMETTIGGMEAVIIKNRSGLYQYLPSQGMVMSMNALMPGMAAAVERPDDYLGYLKERNATRLRTETLNGEPCDVYRYDDPVKRGTTTVWVAQRLRFPLRVEMDNTEGRMTVEISNVMLGAGIEDRIFELPVGVDVVSMGQLMQGMSEVLERRP